MWPLVVLVCIENVNIISDYGHLKAFHALLSCFLLGNFKWVRLAISCSVLYLQTPVYRHATGINKQNNQAHLNKSERGILIV